MKLNISPLGSCNPTSLSDAAAEWPRTSTPPVPEARFGKDHWSTFAYLETRAVDYRGMVDHRHLRCHSGRHPLFADAMRPGVALSERGLPGAPGDGSQYATRLKGARRDDGAYGVEELYDHDDYDCIDDLVAAGLIEVEMPTPDAGDDCYRDALGRPVVAYGEVIRPSFLSGLEEGYLARSARFRLTGRGHEVAAQLRAHKASGGNFHQFVPGA